MPDQVQAGEFAASRTDSLIAELRERRRSIQAFIEEGKALDKAISELEKTAAKIRPRAAAPARALAASSQARAEDLQRRVGPQGGPPPAAPSDSRQSHPDGTNKERIVRFLRENPRGAAIATIARDIGGQYGSVAAAISDLKIAGDIVQVGRGFYKIAESGDASTSPHAAAVA